MRGMTGIFTAALAIGLIGATTAARADGKLGVMDAWIRAAPPGTEMMAGYATLTNTGDERISILTVQSGFPFDLQTFGQPQFVRPDAIGEAKVFPGEPDHYFDTSAFARVPTGPGDVLVRPGNLGRNVLIGPGTRNLDLSLFKNFHITERFTSQLRAEAFNISNTPQFANPNPAGQDITSGDFGRIRGTRLSSERQIQFALRLLF